MLYTRDSFQESWITECQDLCAVGLTRKRHRMEESNNAVRTIATVDLQWIATMRVLCCFDLLVKRMPHAGTVKGTPHFVDDPLSCSKSRFARRLELLKIGLRQAFEILRRRLG